MRAAAVLLLAACGGHGASPDARVDTGDGPPIPDAHEWACAPGTGMPAKVCSVDHLCWEEPSPQGLDFGPADGKSCDYWIIGGGGKVYRLNGDTLTQMAEQPGQYGGVSALKVFSDVDAWAVSSNGAFHWTGGTWIQISTDGFYGVWGSSPIDVWLSGKNGMMSHWDGMSLTTMSTPATLQLGVTYGTASNDVWMLALGNEAVHWNGSQWTSTSFGTNQLERSDLWGANPSTYFAVGSTYPKPQIWRYNGADWMLEHEEAAPPAPLYYASYDAVWGTSANNVWVGGMNLDHVVHYDGANWTNVPLPSAGVQIRSIRGSGPNDVLFMGLRGYLARWNGSEIVELSRDTNGPSWRRIWASAANDIWILGDDNTIRRYNGTTWTAQSSPTIFVWGLSGVSGDDVWAAGTLSQHMQVAHWNGAAWTATDLGVSGSLRAIHVAAANDAWAVGDNGKTFHYNGTWSQVTSPATLRLGAIYGDATEAWAGGDTNTLQHWQNNTWTTVTSPATTDYWDAFGRGPNDVYLSGFLGTVVHYDGNTWTKLTTGTNQLLYDVGGDATRVWFAGSGGAVGLDSGSGFKLLEAGTKQYLNGAHFTSATDGWVIGEYGALLRYQP
ncbi:MAG TPA: hypothetical protein VFV99_01475 [Kofleriaceae bacterium]|nr:hypothetical protein [Kofleriaceae bacterium]